jgi:hypothetical protein
MARGFMNRIDFNKKFLSCPMDLGHERRIEKSLPALEVVFVYLKV